MNSRIKQPNIEQKLIERYHNTFREFDKIRRGFKGKESEMIEAFKLYYNFIKKHHSLNGKTPAQEIGVDLNLGRNRWLSLLKQGLER